MASPDFHRRQAEMLTRISRASDDPKTRAELLRLAAEHSEWARQGEHLVDRSTKPKPKKHEAA
jgi:hypothetical protein